MSFLVGFVALALANGMGATPAGGKPAAASPVVFAHGASSTGWIDFDFAEKRRILIPAKVDGHDTLVELIDGAATSYVDKDFAASIGLRPNAGTKAPTVGMQVQLGGLSLRGVEAQVVDLGSDRADPAFAPFILSDDLFNAVVVDIDFAHRRLAFRDPHDAIRPMHGMVEIPLIRRLGERTVPVSVEGAAPVRFEWFLGDPAPVTVYQPYYQAHGLLQGRPTSMRLGGGLNGQRPQEPVATLRRVRFAGVEFSNVPGVFPSNAVRGSDSDLVAGNIGLGLLSRFHLIVDYPHDRLYAKPYGGAMDAFAKDRLGLYLSKHGTALVVDFVSPGSPAQAAGFRAGEQVAMIDRKPAPAWTASELDGLRHAAKGAVLVFAMKDGGIRRVRAGDYF